MPRTRLYVEQHLQPASDIDVCGDQARYLGRVLRLRPGDELTLFDGRGGEYPGHICTLKSNCVTIRLGSRSDRNTESSLAIHLLQGISRGDRMDIVMQKATELGVTRITPLITGYSQTKLEHNRAEKRVQRWRGIVASACEQSGRNSLPVIERPIKLERWAGENTEASGTRLILRPDAPALLTSTELADPEVTLLIGPEGGFSEDEHSVATALGFTAVNLGPRVLRTETAAIAAVTAMQVLHGDMV